jgi:hypothetical protein
MPSYKVVFSSFPKRWGKIESLNIISLILHGFQISDFGMRILEADKTLEII